MAYVGAYVLCHSFLPARSHFFFKLPNFFFRIAKFPYAAFGPLFAFHCPIFFFTKNNTLNGVCLLNVTAAHWNNICYWGDSAIVSLSHLDRRDTMGLFSSTRQPHTRCALRWTAAGMQRGGSGVEGTGVEWRGGGGRGGQGRAGQGARLLRWTFTGRDFIPLNTPVERAAA